MRARVILILSLTTTLLPSSGMIGDGQWTRRLDRPAERGLSLDEERLGAVYKQSINQLNSVDNGAAHTRDVLLDALWDMGAPKRHLFRVMKKYGTGSRRAQGSRRFFQDEVLFRAYDALSEREKRNIKTFSKPNDFLEHRARASYHHHVPFLFRLFRLPTAAHLTGFGISAALIGFGKLFFDRLETKVSELSGKRIAAYQEMIRLFGHAYTKRLKHLQESPDVLPAHRQLIAEYLQIDKKYTLLTMQWLAALAALTTGTIGAAGSLYAHFQRDDVRAWREEAADEAVEVGQ